MYAMAMESWSSSELVRVELPTPEPGRREVRVAVHAIGVNPVDWKMRTGGPIRLEAGAVRTGDASIAVQAILVAAIAGVLALVWVRARRDATDPAGGPALVAVTALIALSPLFSVQYSCWLVPWAAVASLGGRRERTAAILAAAIVAMGGLLAILYGNATVTIIGSIKLLLLIRNALSVGLVAFWLLTRSPVPTSASAEA